MSGFNLDSPSDNNRYDEKNEDDEKLEDEGDDSEEDDSEEEDDYDHENGDGLATRFSVVLQKHYGKPDRQRTASNEIWEEILASSPLETEQEKLVQEYATTIFRTVKGFSDYRECFADFAHFLGLGITNMSLTTALSCVKACTCMYSTDEVDTFYEESWAIAVLDRCEAVLSGKEPIDEASSALVSKILSRTHKCGKEYGNLMTNRSNLKLQLENQIQLHSIANVNSEMMVALQYSLSLLDNNPASKIATLDMSINLNKLNYKQLANTLLDAYNSMCEQDTESLNLQIAATEGTITKAAVQVFHTLNEGSNKSVFLEACVFLRLLVEPWEMSSPQHMQAKKDIATRLREHGVVEDLFAQLNFWAVEWNGHFGDCGRICFEILLHFFNYFDDLKSVLQTHGAVLSMIKAEAEKHQQHAEKRLKQFQSYETTGSISFKIMNHLK